MNAAGLAIAEAAGSASPTIVALSFGVAEAAALCSAAGVSVVSIAIRPGGGCIVECLTGAGADELRLRFADHVIAETES